MRGNYSPIEHEEVGIARTKHRIPFATELKSRPVPRPNARYFLRGALPIAAADTPGKMLFSQNRLLGRRSKRSEVHRHCTPPLYTPLPLNSMFQTPCHLVLNKIYT